MVDGIGVHGMVGGFGTTPHMDTGNNKCSIKLKIAQDALHSLGVASLTSGFSKGDFAKMDTSFSQNQNVDVESGSLSFQHESTLEQPTTMDEEQLAGIAEEVYLKVALRLQYAEESNVPEYFAWRLINAIEWASPHYEFTSKIAEFLLDGGYVLPQETISIVRKHFELNY